MKHEMMAVYDSAAKAYLPPFFLPNKQMGIRTFTDCLESDDHQFARHPEDYTLFSLGQFDYETAEFFPALEKMHTGLELLPNKE